MQGIGGPEIVIIVLILAILLIPGILYLRALQKTLERCAAESRTLNPTSVWLLLIPLFGVVWNFVVVSGMAKSLRNEFNRRGYPLREAEPGKGVGLAMCILAPLSLVPLLGVAGFLCWVAYWTKINGYAQRLVLPADAPVRKTSPLIWVMAGAFGLLLTAASIAWLTMPRLERSRMIMQEISAISAIKRLHTAQVQYQTMYGHYAHALSELGPPANGAASADGADLIPRQLASGENLGYRFQLAATPTGYQISAAPVVFGSTGRRTFYSDESMTIHQNRDAQPATAGSPELGR